MLHSGESWFRLRNIAGSHDSALCRTAHICEYLRELETECENILEYYSGAYVQLIYEKTEVENLVRLSL
jgi:hypothetical protein